MAGPPAGGFVKVKALSGFCIGGGRDVSPGEVFEIADEWNARRLVLMGFVVPVVAAPAPPKKPTDAAETLAADVVRSREPEPEHREPRARRA